MEWNIAPFGTQALAGSIFVTYARQDAAGKNESCLAGPSQEAHGRFGSITAG